MGRPLKILLAIALLWFLLPLIVAIINIVGHALTS
jgi:hypothetical protein